MTADLGIGANMAIESAVTLCNLLQASHSSHPASHHPSACDLSALFTTYQSKRYVRAKAFMELSGAITRMRSYQSLWKRFFITRIATLPFVQSMQVGRMMQGFAKGPKLEYAPTRTINMEAEGWKIQKQEGHKWVTYAVVTAGVGVAVAYAVVSKWGLSL
jgi:FAD dependent monooxygenase